MSDSLKVVSVMWLAAISPDRAGVETSRNEKPPGRNTAHTRFGQFVAGTASVSRIPIASWYFPGCDDVWLREGGCTGVKALPFYAPEIASDWKHRETKKSSGRSRNGL
jgi:hypothetical protein